MKIELQALLWRYYITYRRFRGRFLNDFIFALSIAAALAVRDISVLGILAAIVFFITLPFTFMAVVRTMLGEIVSEKASGMKEYLKLSGLSSFTYQVYLLTITSAKTIFFTCFVIAGLLFGSTFEKTYDILRASLVETMELYILCALATISFILFLSTLFSEPKVASSVGGLLYASISILSLGVIAFDKVALYYLVSLFPQSALTLTMIFGSKDWPKGVNFTTIKLVVLFDFFLYLILYMYLDQVLKGENGVSKSPLFFLDYFKKKRPHNQTSMELGFLPMESQEENTENEAIIREEDSSSAIYHEPCPNAFLLNKTVRVNNLTRNFKDTKAVDKISFSIYGQQIFCLLGHNGAGKTTTIRMMTGLLDINEGQILYNGIDFAENIEEVRTKIGVCNQQDILFEKLKVSEHLELIAKLRKIRPENIPLAVEEALRKVNLINERNKFSEELSGGNKRKLCLGMAVLGDTKVIFLDEPTSGMDPQNRRVMWQLLKQLRLEGLTILLTTHHLDEADELADRIAIMSRGKLLAMGTSEFFKKNFGVGYHLNLTPIYERISSEVFQSKKSELKGLIKSVIPLAKFDEQVAADVLKCSLPFSTQQDFPRLFRELEQDDTIRINVEMNTLEDVFVNIGLSEDALLKGGNEGAALDIDIRPPECLRERPTYNFFSQTFAIAKRRAYILLRSKRNLCLMILPLVLILVGVVGTLGFKDATGRLAFFQVVVFLSFSLNTAVYCSLPVYEREEKLKYLMDVMGLRNLSYWVGNLIVDFALITIMNLIIYGLYYWFHSQLHKFVTILAPILSPTDFLVLLIPHGLALITLGYAYSFAFDKALSAVKIFPILYFFGLNALHTYALSGVFSRSTTSEMTQNEALAIKVFGLICPSGQLIFAIEIMIGNEKSAISLNDCAFAQICYALVYFLLTMVLESSRLSVLPKENVVGWTSPEPQRIPVNQEEIESERQRAMQTRTDPIKAVNLTKIYNNGYTAVKDVTFSVEPGQIFGLLGPNGAGKSTIFKTLTADTQKTNGSVQLLNQEIQPNMPEVFENVGICPQFNGLWEFLTVREHLMLFGNLKGFRGINLDQAINYYLDVLQLREYANKQAGNLSGGNKRKLCVANAFIGSAHLLFLDEPSTGVDALSRKFLWNSIQQVLKMRQASMVLTTHSMYEAESLSHKIGILINGRFVCLGPMQYLKQKYSQGSRAS